MTKTATDNAPIYIAVTQAKKRAKNPPAAAKDNRREMIIALIVAATKKSMKTRRPVKEIRVMVPTEMTRSARRGLPLRVQRRTFRPEFLEASRSSGQFSAREFLIRRNSGAAAPALVEPGKKIASIRRWKTPKRVSSRWVALVLISPSSAMSTPRKVAKHQIFTSQH